MDAQPLPPSPSALASATAAMSRAIALRERGGPVVAHGGGGGGGRQSIECHKVSLANDEFIQFLTRSAGGATGGAGRHGGRGRGGGQPSVGWRYEPDRPRVRRWLIRGWNRLVHRAD